MFKLDMQMGVLKAKGGKLVIIRLIIKKEGDTRHNGASFIKSVNTITLFALP